jgi:hypothetical protein
MGSVAFESVWILHLSYENSEILRTRFSKICMSVPPWIYVFVYGSFNNCQHVTLYLLTPWSKVLLEKLIAFQLAKKFPAFYGIKMFITAFTSARHQSLS